MTRILFLDRFGELNYMDVSVAYVSCFQEQTRFVCGSNGWDMPRQQAQELVNRISRAASEDLVDLTGLGNAQ